MQVISLVLAAVLAAPGSALVQGTVRDLGGAPLAGVVVYLAGTNNQSTTDARGGFELSAAAGDKVVVVAYLPGCQPARREVEAAPPVTQVDLVLNVVGAAETIDVHTPPPPPGEATTVFTPLDVVRTPGTQADTFRLLRTMPGVVQVDEGAGLFVRGGDVSEVIVLLDGVPVTHPYRYESPTGGFFGFVDPFLLRGVSFSAGGFPARYGNALSAVVDLEGLGMPEAPRGSVTAGLAGVAVNLARPAGERWGLRLAGNLASPRLLFAVNGTATRFRRYPGGRDASASLHRRTRWGEAKLFVLEQSDAVGVELEGEGFAGFVDSETRHRLAVLQTHAELPAGWRLQASFGGGGYRSNTRIGVLAKNFTDTLRGGRLELLSVRATRELRFGVDGETLHTSVDGQVPRRAGDFDGHAGVVPFAVDRNEGRTGAFAEGVWRVGRLAAHLGLRGDRYRLLESTSVDPRAAFSYPFGGGQLRGAWGIYRQSPSSAYFDEARGARRLPPMRAEHQIVGYERGAAAGDLFRVEVYRKNYTRLPLQDEAAGYTSRGHGWARGVDLFAQRRFARGELRASYGYLEARRSWTPPDQRERFTLPAKPWEPDFSIPHSLQLVGSWQATPRCTLGWSWRRASGRPFTPLRGAEPTLDRGYLPLYGPINSRRVPRYERLDVSASRPIALGGRPAIVFVAVNNLFDRANFFEYTYSADFSRRQPVKTASPRSVYFGLSVLDLRKPANQ